MYRLEDYDYELPSALIAQAPSERREASRLLLLNREAEAVEHRRFHEIDRCLQPGDLLVLNDTRVVPGRLLGRRETGGKVEILVADPYKEPESGRTEGYECLVKASKKPRPGAEIFLENGFRAEVLTPVLEGRARVRFWPAETPLLEMLERIGRVPLPPYIRRNGKGPPTDDRTSYQTVYADKPGAVAAPTAGLHFSEELLQRLRDRGIETARITLHVGYGTFAPIRTEDVRKHSMHSEYAQIAPDEARRIQEAREQGRCIVAVGTTVVRTLEWVALERGRIEPYSGFCSHYIYPGYTFRAVGAMITNFHLPRSTLLLLVSAFAGRDLILQAYREAVQGSYRFFSYGDAMLIL